MTHRIRLAITALALGLIGVAAAAEPPAIPFDAKKAKELKDRDRAWDLDSTLGAYKAVGKKSPKWDAHVERALLADADRIHGSPWAVADAEQRQREALQKAADAGCNDPLVQYQLIRRRPRAKDNSEDDQVKEWMLKAARGLAASKYPDIRKAHGWLNTIAELLFEVHREKPTEENVKLAGECLDELLKVMAVLAKDKSPSLRKEFLELCEMVHRNGHTIGQRKEWFDRLDKEVLAKTPKDSPVPHVAAGVFLIQYAWDARGKGFANTVTEEGWKAFKERLTEAERRLTKAWELDTSCAPAAANMIRVCMGLEHDRDEMEKWFRRALEADPNHKPAVTYKMNYLAPKWHGSREELLEFGRQLAKTDRWDTSLPLELVSAHHELANESRNIMGYFRGDPEVWKDIEPVLEAMRKKHPDSPLGASLYLYYAWLSDRNAAQADEYVRAQKLELRRGQFRNDQMFEAAKQWAKEGAAKGGGK
jgi:hypothetical protein